MTVLAADDRLILRTDPDGFSLALPHFQKYGVFDDIEIDDVTEKTFEYHLIGSPAERELLAKGVSLLGAGELDHAATSLDSAPIRLIRESPFGPEGLTILGAIDDAPRVRDSLRSLAIPTVDLAATDAEFRRVREGRPVFGADVTAGNLPQEVARDKQAINFVKGCYLGQETVARIDALGHVNKLLRGFLIAGEVEAPKPGSLLEVEGKRVGTVTSCVATQRPGRYLALGYIKATLAAAGTEAKVLTESGEETSLLASVAEFPLPESW